MHRFALLLAAFAFLTPSPAQTTTPAQPKTALDKATMEQYVRHLFVWGPQIQVRVSDSRASQALPGFTEVPVMASSGAASQEIIFYVSPDGKKIIQGTVYDVTKNPFDQDRDRIRTDLQPSFGAAGAPVVIAMFSDFQCSFCREEAKIVRQNIQSTYPSDVRVYFKDYPLESIHPWAKSASIAGRCVFRQKPAAFWEFHDWIFENQKDITPENLKDKVTEFTKGKGVEPVQLSACIDSKATAADVEKSVAEGKVLGVNSTPTLFVNGRRVVGQVPWQNLKEIIDHELEYSKAHGGGEKCCEVTLPSPLKP